MILFQDKDSDYLSFLSKPENRTGFVVNTTRKPSKSYVMLHKATWQNVHGRILQGVGSNGGGADRVERNRVGPDAAALRPLPAYGKQAAQNR